MKHGPCAASPLALALLACSGSNPEGPPAPPELTVELELLPREQPPYPFQPLAFIGRVEGARAQMQVFCTGPGDVQWAGAASGRPEVVVPQIAGTWQAETFVLTGSCSATVCADRLNRSNRVPFEVVPHTIDLQTVSGFPGREPAVLALAGASQGVSFELRIFDQGLQEVGRIPADGGECTLDPAIFPLRGRAYYLQAVTDTEATCRLLPVWVPSPGDTFGVDLGRGGFLFRSGEPKEIAVTGVFFADITLTDAFGTERHVVSTVGGVASITVSSGGRADEVWTLDVRAHRPTGHQALVRVLVAIAAEPATPGGG